MQRWPHFLAGLFSAASLAFVAGVQPNPTQIPVAFPNPTRDNPGLSVSPDDDPTLRVVCTARRGYKFYKIIRRLIPGTGRTGDPRYPCDAQVLSQPCGRKIGK